MSELLLSRQYQVDFSHVDNRGFARPAFLFGVMQDAAALHADLLGLGRNDLPAFWVLSRMRLTLNRPLLPYERVQCETWCAGTRGAAWIRLFSFSAADKPLGQAVSMWALLDADTRRILRPNQFGPASRFVPADRQTLPDALPKLSCEALRPHHSHLVTYSDLDVNNHLNNARVAELVCDALDLQEQTGFVAALQINYIAETACGQELLLSSGTEADTRLVRGAVDGQTHFEASASLCPLAKELVQ